MEELLRMIRALYLVAAKSERQEITLDTETLKWMLDNLKRLRGGAVEDPPAQ